MLGFFMLGYNFVKITPPTCLNARRLVRLARRFVLFGFIIYYEMLFDFSGVDDLVESACAKLIK